MAAIDFPNSPSVNDTHTVGSKTWKWTGVSWNLVERPLSYVHTQLLASDTWVVVHNLNFYPNVTVVDSGGSMYEGEIAYNSANQLTLTFSAAFSGTAYLSQFFISSKICCVESLYDSASTGYAKQYNNI